MSIGQGGYSYYVGTARGVFGVCLRPHTSKRWVGTHVEDEVESAEAGQHM